MSQGMYIKVKSPPGLALLKELETLGVISIEGTRKRGFNGKQYRGIVPSEEKDKFRQHIESIRNEWERDIS